VPRSDQKNTCEARMPPTDDAERRRVQEMNEKTGTWRRWGPYLAERQWGTVREDYSEDGEAWAYFPHDHARSRAYRWGEDGIGGFCDSLQRLCLAVALWNGRDPILKERLFGLTNDEGNHGEDPKELYYYLDATPTHSYLKMLYKYPQAAYPYRELIEASRRRGKTGEHELIDTGILDGDRYFDVLIEYAKADVNDLILCLTVHNRGPVAAPLHVLPQLWFRNRWSWSEGERKPLLRGLDATAVAVEHKTLGHMTAHYEAPEELLFTENETNRHKLYGTGPPSGHFKDAFHEHVVHGRADRVNPARTGTKAAGLYRLEVPAGGNRAIRLRLAEGERLADPFGDFDAILAVRRAEADAFYARLQQHVDDPDQRLIQRQALAGMIWGKQFYHLDVPQWQDGDPTQPRPHRRNVRNADWRHLNNADIISMPDKWEYPWYAAWDLAFHAVPLALIDTEFAKQQLVLLCREWYMHPNGQMPAYEWQFDDANPPVHAWATWRVFQMDRQQRGDATGDLAFLERVFHKLLLNFTWWVNRKDAAGRNIFQGGFLGLDNIGVFDRSKPLPTGGYINQADGTAWMAMYSANLMRMALELARYNPVYEDVATKFFEHFLHIAEAMTNMAGKQIGLWDDEDKFYYDELILPGGEIVPLKVRSMVGLIPLFAVEILDEKLLEQVPQFTKRLEWFLRYRHDLADLVSRWEVPGRKHRHLLSLLRGHRMKCLLRRLLDPDEFLSDYGVRALSRHHQDHPYRFEHGGLRHEVRYVPAESDSFLFGGNSNWRGPIWMPLNYLLIESLRRFHHYYGPDFLVECPTGSGTMMNLRQVADELARRLTRLFTRDARGRRPIYGERTKMQTDPEFKDHILFYEYFHGDTGRGVGAEHQTGWTGLVAKLIDDLHHEEG
jgi:hypothetical protein